MQRVTSSPERMDRFAQRWAHQGPTAQLAWFASTHPADHAEQCRSLGRISANPVITTPTTTYHPREVRALIAMMWRTASLATSAVGVGCPTGV